MKLYASKVGEDHNSASMIEVLNRKFAVLVHKLVLQSRIKSNAAFVFVLVLDYL